MSALSAFAREFYNDPADPIIGLFFGALEIYSLNNEILKKKTLSADKVDEIWHMNKEITLSAISTVSYGAYIVTWMDKVQLIALGRFEFINNCLGWIGRGITSAIHACEILTEFNQGIIEYNQVKIPGVKREIAMKQIERLLRITFSVCFATWGILNSIHAFTAGKLLFFVADQCFFYGIVFFLADFGYSLFFL